MAFPTCLVESEYAVGQSLLRCVIASSMISSVKRIVSGLRHWMSLNCDAVNPIFRPYHSYFWKQFLDGNLLHENLK